MEQHRLKGVSEHGADENILNQDEVIGGWRKLHNGECRNF
jgi:hypothetical protein